MNTIFFKMHSLSLQKKQSPGEPASLSGLLGSVSVAGERDCFRSFSCAVGVVLCLTLAAFPAYAQGLGSQGHQQVSDTIGLAIAKANSGKLDQSLDLFDKSLKASGRDVVALLNRGKVYLIKGRLDRAVKDLNGAIKLDPNLTEAFLARGMAYRLEGDFSKAAKDFDKALNLDPGNTAALLHRAALFFDTGDHENALRDLDRLIKINPGMTRALGNRAYILEQIGRYDDAIKDLGGIIAQDAENLMAIKHLGFIYRQMDEPAKALKWYEMALKLETDPHHRKVLQDEIQYLRRKAQK